MSVGVVAGAEKAAPQLVTRKCHKFRKQHDCKMLALTLLFQQLWEWILRGGVILPELAQPIWLLAAEHFVAAS